MIVRWNPVQQMHRLQQEMNSLFDHRMPNGAEEDSPTTCDWRPSVDVYEDNERFVLWAELPGIDPNRVDLTVEDNRLSLRGERKLENVEKKENYHHIERMYGTFARTFTLPNTVDGNKITADFKQGLLTVSIPKKPEVQPKQITVKIHE